MLKPLSISTLLVLATLAGCNVSSPKGGSMNSADGFRVVVPAEIELQQGAVQTINVALQRDAMFKQDVKLSVKSSPGLSVDPANTTIKASDSQNALIKIGAAKDAALGEYRVSVTGTPSAGEPTMTEVRVKVVTP